MRFPRLDIGLFANIKATVYLKQEIIAGGALQGRLFTHTIPPLCLQQRPLSLQSPAITAKPAIASQYTMAGNQHANPVLATSRRHGSHCPGFVDPRGHLAVAQEIALADTQQKLPDFYLKRG